MTWYCRPRTEEKGFQPTARRVVVKVEHHPGELFPRVGFIVTNLTLPSRAVVRFYNNRGTAEQWIKEGKQGHCRSMKRTPLIWGLLRENSQQT